MKKIFLLLALIANLFVFARADVMPYYVGSINSSAIGVYQAPLNIKVYQEPNENSPLLLDVQWSSQKFSCLDISASNLFVVFLPARQLAFLLAVDETENWVQIVFYQNGERRGWVKKDDPYNYMNWRTFYNLYGRKYGVYFMKDAPEEARNLYSSGSDDAQKVGKINLPQWIKLTVVKGNWIMAQVFDMDKISKIGYLKWRAQNGEIYLFPQIK